MTSTPGVVIDETSRAIIEQLQEDGRRPYAAIGKAVGLSEAAVRQRVQKLTDAGVMQIVAVTDPLQTGLARQAMISIVASGDVERVADELALIDEVDYIVVTAGSVDLMIEVVVQDDDAPARTDEPAYPHHRRRRAHRVLRLPQARQTDLQLGCAMSGTRTPHRGEHP